MGRRRQKDAGSPPRATARTGQLHPLAAIALLLLLGCLTYANSFEGVFVFDDMLSLAKNPSMRQVWPLTEAMSAPRHTSLAGRPVAALTFAINYAAAPRDTRDAFSGAGLPSTEALLANVWGYHFVNLGIHLACGLLLFGVARRTFARMRHESGAGGSTTVGLAAATAALWLVHPLTTASVTYIIQRTESLMACFYLATLYAAIRAAEEPSTRRVWSVVAVVACLMGVGTKEAMVTAPVAVILWDWLFDGRRWRERLAARWPLYSVLASTWFPLAWIIAGAPRAASVGVGLHGVSSWTYLITQAGVLLHYLRLVVLPWPLALDYDWPLVSSFADGALPFVTLAALGGATIYGLRKRMPWAFAPAAFFLVLAPTSSVVPIVTEVAGEQRMYLPLAALLGLVVVAGWRLLARMPRPITVVSAAGLVVVLATLTTMRNTDYHSERGLYEQTLAVVPENARAHTNLATLLLAERHADEAEFHLREAVRLRPAYVEAQANLGIALATQGRMDQALAALREAVRLQPDYVDAWRNIAEVQASAGRFADALPAYERVLEIQPDDRRTLGVTAWLMSTSPDAALRNGARAVVLAERLVHITGPSDPESADVLAAAYAEAGRFPEAVATAERAVALAAGRPDIRPSLEARLDGYRRGQPFRSLPPPGPDTVL